VSRRFQTILLLGAALLAAGVGPPAAQAADPAKRAGLVEKLHRLWHQIRQKREDIAETEDREDRVADLLEKSQTHLEHSQRELRLAKERVAAAQREVDVATKRLYEAHRRVRQHSQRLGRRIAHHYVEGTVSYADVLLGAASVSDFLDRQYLVERVLDWDRAVLRDLRQAQRQVEAERANLLRRRQLLLAAKAEIAAKTAKVMEQLDAHTRLLAQIQKERQLQEQELDELEQDSAVIEQRLKEEEQRRAGRGQGRFRLRWSGTFSLPCYGPISSGFGYRVHPILGRRRLHTGIDFAAPMGAPVLAAAAGEVFHAGWLGGYGRCIIILHGDGISTLYGHCSVIEENVRPGEFVRRGQVIGRVGSTGFSTGPHLHFEVRKNGVPINPMP
jgi:murein DD-endopeptidase MepM/ murein hydrolase activator NlpD